MSASTAVSQAMPLDAGQAAAVDSALAGLTPAQMQWVSGYAAGLAAAAQSAVPPAVPAANSDAAGTLTILYGSQTGNGEGVARRLEAAAQSAGFGTRLTSLAELHARGELTDEEYASAKARVLSGE